MNAENKKIALEQIHRFLQLAKNMIHEDEKLAQQYVTIARRISMVSRVRIPVEYRRQICKVCKKFILPGVNCRVRIRQRREPHVVITCGHCGTHMRFPVKERK